MLSVMDVANYVTTYSYNLPDEKKKYPVSNLRLQKLLYYIQGRSYMDRGEPLFQEDFYAWRYGPVNKETYRAFRIYGYDEIPQKNSIHFNALSIFDNLDLTKKLGSDTVEKIRKKLHEKKDPNFYVPREDDRKLIHHVLEKTKDCPNFKLIEHSHNEDPWKNAYDTTIDAFSNDNVISKEAIQLWFENREEIFN